VLFSARSDVCLSVFVPYSYCRLYLKAEEGCVTCQVALCRARDALTSSSDPLSLGVRGHLVTCAFEQHPPQRSLFANHELFSRATTSFNWQAEYRASIYVCAKKQSRRFSLVYPKRRLDVVLRQRSIDVFASSQYILCVSKIRNLSHVTTFYHTIGIYPLVFSSAHCITLGCLRGPPFCRHERKESQKAYILICFPNFDRGDAAI
jgi:hypothetical protein